VLTNRYFADEFPFHSINYDQEQEDY
jgi:hypothetical protein